MLNKVKRKMVQTPKHRSMFNSYDIFAKDQKYYKKFKHRYTTITEQRKQRQQEFKEFFQAAVLFVTIIFFLCFGLTIVLH